MTPRRNRYIHGGSKDIGARGPGEGPEVGGNACPREGARFTAADTPLWGSEKSGASPHQDLLDPTLDVQV